MGERYDSQSRGSHTSRREMVREPRTSRRISDGPFDASLAPTDHCATRPRVVAPRWPMETNASAPTTRRVPPGPSSLPLVGNLLDIRAAGDMAAFFDRLWKTHGDTFRFKLFGTDALVVAHPEALK